MNSWVFNKEIAEIYKLHVRQHIPNYNQVIDKSINICQKFCSKDDPIIDVGCATGETLELFYKNGFRNLHGVDNSQDMLDKCNPKIAKLHYDTKLPNHIYKAVIANWVLHFIKDKELYLKTIYNNLDSSGLLILSEKTADHDKVLNFYHDIKRKNGVSEYDITKKTESLKNIMFVCSVEWYLTTLKQVGFKQIDIIDADWCFTSFLCQK
jgi:tRNA (cmo5U34)-methyltransferase